jgi:uncharacterized protein (TIGR03435 family)
MIRLGLLLVALSAALPLAAQQPPPAFESASVKRNVSGSLQRRLGASPGGKFTALNVTALQLIGWAYQLSRTRVVSTTGWLSSDQFDVEARAAGEVPPPRVREMVRQLLADRFGLVVHNEQRQLQAFALVPDRKDGRLGPQLRSADPMCKDTGRPPKLPTNSAEFPSRIGCVDFIVGAGVIILRGMPLSRLADLLSPILGEPVVDGGSLSGVFDADLHWTWTPEQLVDQPIGTTPEQLDPSGISLEAALIEQLGLHLQRQRRSMEVLVIDSVKRPTPD